MTRINFFLNAFFCALLLSFGPNSFAEDRASEKTENTGFESGSPDSTPKEKESSGPDAIKEQANTSKTEDENSGPESVNEKQVSEDKQSPNLKEAKDDSAAENTTDAETDDQAKDEAEKPAPKSGQVIYSFEKNQEATAWQEKIKTYFSDEESVLKWDEPFESTTAIGLYNRGVHKVRKLDYEEAESLFKQSLELNVDNFSAFNNLLILHQRDGRMNDYRNFINSKLEKFPDSKIVKIADIELLFAENKGDDALKKGKLILKDDERNIHIMRLFANYYYDNKKFELTRVILRERALEIAPNDPTLLYMMAKLELREKNPEKALEYFKKCAAVQPDFTEAIEQVGIMLSKKRKFAEAYPYLYRLNLLKPGDRNASINYANALRGIKKYKDSLELYNKVIEKYPDSVVAKYNKAIVLLDYEIPGIEDEDRLVSSSTILKELKTVYETEKNKAKIKHVSDLIRESEKKIRRIRKKKEREEMKRLRKLEGEDEDEEESEEVEESEEDGEDSDNEDEDSDDSEDDTEDSAGEEDDSSDKAEGANDETDEGSDDSSSDKASEVEDSDQSKSDEDSDQSSENSTEDSTSEPENGQSDESGVQPEDQQSKDSDVKDSANGDGEDSEDKNSEDNDSEEANEDEGFGSNKKENDESQKSDSESDEAEDKSSTITDSSEGVDKNAVEDSETENGNTTESSDDGDGGFSD